MKLQQRKQVTDYAAARKKNQRRDNFHILTLYISGGWDSGITHAEVWSVCVCGGVWVCGCVCVCVCTHTSTRK